MSKDDGESDGAGYRRPPKAHRFKKGQSGNPRGRPKKQKPADSPAAGAFANVVLAEAYRLISLKENGVDVTLTAMQAAMRALAINAVKGDIKAMTLLINTVATEEAGVMQARLETLEMAERGIRRVKAEFARCDRAGQPRPEILPHPDDILMDYENLDVVVNGPRDEVEKEHWDKADQRRADALEAMAQDKAYLKELDDDPAMRAFVKRELVDYQFTIDLMDWGCPREEVRRRRGFNIHKWRERRGFPKRPPPWPSPAAKV